MKADGSQRNRGWYTRGYVPHYDEGGVFQTITYRLEDSVPACVLHRLREELNNLPAERMEVERRKRMEELLDTGYGSCLLRRPEAAELVVENWRHFHGKRYDLLAYVVMPTHCHVLIRVFSGFPLGRIVQSWKTFTGRRLGAMAPDVFRETGGRVWQRGYWDRAIRNEEHFRNALDYIVNNPVKAGLVKTVEEWPWSFPG